MQASLLRFKPTIRDGALQSQRGDPYRFEPGRPGSPSTFSTTLCVSRLGHDRFRSRAHPVRRLRHRRLHPRSALGEIRKSGGRRTDSAAPFAVVVWPSSCSGCSAPPFSTCRCRTAGRGVRSGPWPWSSSSEFRKSWPPLSWCAASAAGPGSGSQGWRKAFPRPRRHHLCGGWPTILGLVLLEVSARVFRVRGDPIGFQNTSGNGPGGVQALDRVWSLEYVECTAGHRRRCFRWRWIQACRRISVLHVSMARSGIPRCRNPCGSEERSTDSIPREDRYLGSQGRRARWRARVHGPARFHGSEWQPFGGVPLLRVGI